MPTFVRATFHRSHALRGNAYIDAPASRSKNNAIIEGQRSGVPKAWGLCFVFGIITL